MQHRWCVGCGLWLMLVGSTGSALCRAEQQRYEFAQILMGMDFKLTFYAADSAAAKRAAEATFSRVAALNGILSDYDPESELSRLSQTAGQGRAVAVSDDLWFVLSRSQRLAERTDGAFDVTVGPLVRLWRRSRREHELPTPERLSEARRATGYRQLVLDAKGHTVKLLVSGMRLDLGGIAAGYAVDEAMNVLNQHGIHRAMIDASGDIRVGDPPPGEAGWRIGIEGLQGTRLPDRVVVLANRAISSAGDGRQFVEIAGQRYSHIVDPKTGLGLTGRSSVTVIAADCITADALDTAISVLGQSNAPTALELVRQTPGAECLIQSDEPGNSHSMETGGMKQLATVIKKGAKP